MTIRRVITGHDESGQAIIVSDSPLDAVDMPGIGDLYRIWSADEAPVFPDKGINPAAENIFPPLGGFRFFIFTLEPNQSAALDHREGESVVGDLAEVFADNDSGFHQTDTVDFEVVLSGEATLQVGNGEKVVLKVGDTIVHNGANHAWSNETNQRAVLAGCMVGAKRES